MLSGVPLVIAVLPIPIVASHTKVNATRWAVKWWVMFVGSSSWWAKRGPYWHTWCTKSMQHKPFRSSLGFAFFSKSFTFKNVLFVGWILVSGKQMTAILLW